MLALVKGLFGGANPWFIAGLVAVGLFLGGLGVHKWYQANQVAMLKAEISRIQADSKDRIQLAQETAERADARAAATLSTIKKVKVYVPSNPACDLGPDAIGLLNRGRQQLPTP